MKKRILAFALSLALCLCCGCSGSNSAKVNVGKISGGKTPWSLAFNPVIQTTDNELYSARVDIANGMKTDLKEKNNFDLYNSSKWSLAFQDDNNDWYRHAIYGVSALKNKNGKSGKAVPYSYTFTADGYTTLGVYDVSKIKMSTYGDDLFGQGVIFNFTENKEAFCFVADADCTVDILDPSFGNITLLKGIGNISYDNLGGKSAKGLLISLYLNERVLWQEMLGNDELLGSAKTAVEFPTLNGLELVAGDSIVFLVQQITETADVETGYNPLPDKYYTVTKTIRTPYQVELSEEEARDAVPFITDGESTFTVFRPENASKDEIKIISEFVTKMKKQIDADVEFKSDSLEGFDGYRLLVYKTSDKASEAALSEIQSGNAHDADFIIRGKDKDFVIAADNDVALQFALDYFLKTYCKDSDSAIPKNVNYISSKNMKKRVINIAGKSIADYKVVISHVPSYIETVAAEQLVKDIDALTGHLLPIVNDGTPKTANEILIGNTNRTSSNYSKLATASVSSDYSINLSNGTLSVIGKEAYGTSAGAMYLSKLLQNGGSLENGFSFNGSYDSGYSLPKGYKLTWSDEFNGTSLSKTWRFISKTSEKNTLGGYNYTTANNAKVENGTLIQSVTRKGNDIYGTSFESLGRNSMQFKYGYAEIRIKTPVTQGCSVSFWTKGPLGDFLETDIYENFGNPFNMKPNLHTWTQDGHRNLLGGVGSILNLSAGTTNPEPYGYEYHTFGWEWDDDRSTFYYDGVMNTTFDSTSSTFDCFDRSAYFIMSVDAVTTTYGGDKNPLPSDFVSDKAEVDWIRIYQKEDNGASLYVKK